MFHWFDFFNMDILEIKKKLYNELKGLSQVVGAGIKERNGMEYIVIYLTSTSQKFIHKIPSTFEGVHVETEIKGNIKAL
jgi:hypothetical protein